MQGNISLLSPTDTSPLGTGDIDCVYHFALDELHEVCKTNPQMADQSEMLEIMVGGNRLRDISDLPFDIAVQEKRDRFANPVPLDISEIV